MKRFSRTYKYNAYLSAALLTFCCTAVLYSDDRSQCKPRGSFVFSQSKPCPYVPATCKELKACLKLLQKKQVEEVTTGCRACDQSIPFSCPTTIKQSGRYCLTADLDVSGGPAIAVAANVDRVVLDLNNHTITGSTDLKKGALIDVLGNNTDITIINGVVKPLGLTTTAVRVQNAEHVTLAGLLIEGNATGGSRGIFLADSTDFSIENCLVKQISFVPLELNRCKVGKVTHCSFVDNVTNVSDIGLVEVANCQTVHFAHVSLDQNAESLPANLSSRGFSVSNQSNGITFLKCSYSNNVNRRFGFGFFDSTDCTCTECEAINNTRLGESAGDIHGFIAQNSSRITWRSCMANNNSTEGTGCGGFALGFRLLSADECCILDCLATSNSAPNGPTNLLGRGFDISGVAAKNYLSLNTALNNNGIGFASGGSGGDLERVQAGGVLDVRSGGSGNNVLAGNYAEGNGTNYRGVGREVPSRDGFIAVYNINSGMFEPRGGVSALPPTTWINIDAQQS